MLLSMRFSALRGTLINNIMYQQHNYLGFSAKKFLRHHYLAKIFRAYSTHEKRYQPAFYQSRVYDIKTDVHLRKRLIKLM